MLLHHVPQVQATEPTSTAEGSLAAIRAELEEQRDFRREQIEQLNCDTADAVTSGDSARLQVTQILAASAGTALDEINAALRRLDAGDYGVCQDCGNLIPLERLEVLPMSRLCTACQYLLDTGRWGRNARRGM